MGDGAEEGVDSLGAEVSHLGDGVDDVEAVSRHVLDFPTEGDDGGDGCGGLGGFEEMEFAVGFVGMEEAKDEIGDAGGSRGVEDLPGIGLVVFAGNDDLLFDDPVGDGAFGPGHERAEDDGDDEFAEDGHGLWLGGGGLFRDFGGDLCEAGFVHRLADVVDEVVAEGTPRCSVGGGSGEIVMFLPEGGGEFIETGA